MTKTMLAAAIAAASVLGLAGCDVKKTQEGHADVKLPKYDVTTPDVTVGKKSETVTVPKVETEKRTVGVPTVDVKTAKEKEQEQSQKQMGAAGTSQ